MQLHAGLRGQALQARPAPCRTATLACARQGHTSRRRCRVEVRAMTGGTPSVVITGASSGIGKATALLMARQGWQVFAGVRKQSDGDMLQSLHSAQPAPSRGGAVTPVIIDVLKPDTITSAAQQVNAALRSAGAEGSRLPLTGLVNNAGKVTLAPLEYMPVDVFEDQIQVNLVGALRVTQAFLPLMRPDSTDADGTPNEHAERRTARIVNISSQSGTVAFPLFGGYAASKFGLEAFSDCLRYEVHSQGIDVVCVQPGPIKSEIWARASRPTSDLLEGLSPEANILYGDLIGKITRATRTAEEKGATCEEVAELISLALTTTKPRSRYMFGKGAILQMVVRKLLPDRLWDPLVYRSLNKL